MRICQITSPIEFDVSHVTWSLPWSKMLAQNSDFSTSCNWKELTLSARATCSVRSNWASSHKFVNFRLTRKCLIRPWSWIPCWSTAECIWRKRKLTIQININRHFGIITDDYIFYLNKNVFCHIWMYFFIPTLINVTLLSK